MKNLRIDLPQLLFTLTAGDEGPKKVAYSYKSTLLHTKKERDWKGITDLLSEMYGNYFK